MKKQALLTLAIGCCTFSVLTVSCEQQERNTPAEQATEPTVKVFPIITQKVTETGEWFAYIRGKEDTDIHPRISGFLLEQCYMDGQRVKADDVLFRIDPELYQAVLDQAKANLSAAEANYAATVASKEKAELDLKRYELLVRTNAASAKELDDARQRFREAEATVDAALANIDQQKAALKDAQINLDYCVIKAPYDGVVGAAQAFKGDLVSPATKLANMTSLDPMFVRFSINSEKLIEAFREHGHIQGKPNSDAPEFTLTLDNGDVYPIKGKITALESKVEDSGLIDVQGEIPNPKGILRAGMSARIHIDVAERETILVPPVAIRTVMRQNFIVIIAKDNTPRMIPVNIDGSYTTMVTEANGYSSEQTMVAISDRGKPLMDYFREYGYEKASEVPVLADAENGVAAVNMSSANSRLAEGQTPRTIKTEPYSFRPVLPPALQQAVAMAKAKAKAEAEGTPLPTPDVSHLSATEPPYPVEVTKLLQQDVAEEDEWFGKLRGVNETVIRAQVSGFLLSQDFEDGELVKKGDVLYRIDPAPFEAALEKARANLAAAEASYKQAQARLEMYRQDYKRYSDLVSKSPGAVAEKTITDTQTSIKTEEAAVMKAQATIAQMKAAVRQAEINLSYTVIQAPFDGRVGIHNVSKGDLVDATMAKPLVTISSINPMRVDFDISGSAALEGFTAHSNKTLKQKAAAKDLEFSIILEDGTQYPVKGHIVTADNAMSESTGTLKVIGQVDNVDGGLRSGMPVRIRTGLKTTKGAYLVPARAPMFANGQNAVMMLDDTNAPVMVPVTLGAIVTIPVMCPDGKERVQPMQIIDADRNAMAALLCAVADAPSPEAMVLHGASVKDWGEYLLRKADVADFRALAEKQAGKPLPDDAPEKAGVKDWGELLLHDAGVHTYRQLALQQAHAKDELDLIAQGKGFKDLLEMVIKQQGISDPANARVVVEGTIMAAAKTFAANQKVKARVNKLTPVDFIYQSPRSVVPSITSDKVNKQKAKTEGNN